MTCNDLSERIVDYLYDELPARERAELDAHLSGCPRCRHEVESLGAARQSAREALAGPLAETPPPWVRQAVLEAARAAVRSGEPGRVSVAAPGPDGAGAWQRLWSWLRRPWFAPAFVTVSAMVVFLVARGPLLDRPGRALDQAMQAPPAVDQAATSAESVEPDESGEPAKGLRVAERQAAGKGSGFAQPPPPRPQPQPEIKTKTKTKTKAKTSSRQAAARSKSVPSPAVAPKKALVFDEKVPAEEANTPPAVARPADLDRAAPARASAPGARGRAELQQAPRPAPSFFIESPSTAREASIPARAPAAPAARRPGAPEPVAELAVSRSARAGAAAAADESEDEAQPSDGIRRLVARAEALFAQRRFAEAARIYADLLRRHPKHPDVERWKKRRAAAESAARP